MLVKSPADKSTARLLALAGASSMARKQDLGALTPTTSHSDGCT